MSIFAQDIAVFMSAHGLGTAAELDGVAVEGIWDNGWAEVFDGVATRQPSYTLASTASEHTTTTSTLVVEGATYRVRSVQPDGTGLTRLALELQ